VRSNRWGNSDTIKPTLTHRNKSRSLSLFDDHPTLSMETTGDSVKLIEQLSGLWELPQDAQNALFTKSTVRSSAQAALTPSAVGLTFSVSTFVAQKSFSNFAIPPFASHWGIVYDSAPRLRVLFHLLYNAERREVKFEGRTWQTEWSNHQVMPVGKTRYGFGEIWQIGNNTFLGC
jgi:hypothetical protein